MVAHSNKSRWSDQSIPQSITWKISFVCVPIKMVASEIGDKKQILFYSSCLETNVSSNNFFHSLD